MRSGSGIEERRGDLHTAPPPEGDRGVETGVNVPEVPVQSALVIAPVQGG